MLESWFWVLPVLLIGGIAAYSRFRARSRIIHLDWPERFENANVMRNHCKLFLEKHGWKVRVHARHDIQLVISNRSHQVAVGTLPHVDYFGDRGERYSVGIPDHFVNAYALAAERWKKPVALVTDFVLRKEIVDSCRQRGVYPIHYKDLMTLANVVPPRDKIAAKAKADQPDHR